MRKLLFILIFAITFSACTSDKQKQNTISISGAFALYPMTIKWSEEYKKIYPEIRFNISAGGAGKGMTDALSQTVDLGMFSREISDEEIKQGVWWVGLCIDAVLPTISEDNPYFDILKARGITRNELKEIFIDKTITDWSQLIENKKNSPIEIYTRSDACGAAGTWAKYLGGKQENLTGTGVHGDPALAEAISKSPKSIGYNNTAFIYDIKTGKKYSGIEVIPLDLDGNGKIGQNEDFYDNFDSLLEAIKNDVYPSPPARELYFVSKGKPEKQATLDFIKWALTDGQKFIKEAGYVPIPQDKINKYLKKIEE
ncbi:MAG: PstS family phosphate ABC transporter substrate-binding protein [Bacteroidales bacterium]|nr:PstS family phosphate ABC transporter substrate-binding protein [Bacteroidales bacterium]